MKKEERLNKIKEFLSTFWGIEHVEISQWYHTCYWIDEIGSITDDLFFCGWVKNPKRWWVARNTKKTDIWEKNYFAIDIDLRKQYATINNCDFKDVPDEALYQQIDSIKEMLSWHPLLSQWRYIVFTWNGCHVYFVWDSTNISPEDYQDWVKEIYRSRNMYTNSIWWEFNYYFADNSTANIDRILRIPFSFNTKETNPGGKKAVRIVYENNEKSEMVANLSVYAEAYRYFVKKNNEVEYKPEIENKIDTGFMTAFVERCNQLKIRDVLDKLWIRYSGNSVYEWDRKTNWRKIWDNWVFNFSDDSSDYDRAVWRAYSFVKKYLRHTERKETINRFKENFKEIAERAEENWNKFKKEEKKEEFKIPTYSYSRQDKAFYYPSPIFDDVLWCIYKWELVTIVADWNAWKTTFALDMILRNTRLGSKCFYLNLEFPLGITFEKKRQDVHGKTKITMTQLTDAEKIDLNNYVTMQLSKFDNDTMVWISINDLIKKLAELKEKGYELVFVDTFSKIDWNMWWDSWSSQNKSMVLLQDFVWKTWLSVVMLHHNNKKKEFSWSKKIFDLSNVFVTISIDERIWTDTRVYELKKDKNSRNAKMFARYEKWEYILDEVF